ncbi:KinB signaling pathway activation protein [Caldalkalibacillus thermarum TA2.A1]|uniref:KinB signaling pathway activation protein n=1 Tax=Caldalkalibacillus thermarum (strain TA2.A1) TaxID=986075 RepID=F5L9I9_CALTT|nr:KinB-signaling pathway activation protein [Caldalkalibacillus thermarum]EGL81976.1 KinB signaling pathway activation protein [Caldalkalibacillus thermarum TA2.A1]
MTTLLVGGLTILVTSTLINWEGFQAITSSAEEFLAGAIFLFAVGMTFSAISQMGFFAYLLVNRLALGLFKSKKVWHYTQIVLILFTFFDLVYFRYTAFATHQETWLNYVILPAVLLIVSLVFAYIKAQQTNENAFVPALFVLFVVTTVEAVPALVINDPIWVMLMLCTLFVCNVWQLLWLHRLTAEPKKKSA